MPTNPPFNLNNPAKPTLGFSVLMACLLIGSPALAADSDAKAAKPAESQADAPAKTGPDAAQPETENCKGQGDKLILGATAEFAEEKSGFLYMARVDTGATTCSIHAEKVRIPDGVEIEKKGSKKMMKNIGRKITFELIDADGKRKRVESTIADTVRVKTSERKERRYKVWLTLRHGGVKRRVHVTLNDRSHMEYPLLIGRNFLCGKFLVDVEQEKTPMPSDKKKAVATKSDKEKASGES